MSQPMLRPAATSSEKARADALPHQFRAHSAYPQRRRPVRPGWKATIVRAESFAKLRAIQKSLTDPAIDLSYLMDACLQMALEAGPDAIVRRAFDGIAGRVPSLELISPGATR